MNKSLFKDAFSVCLHHQTMFVFKYPGTSMKKSCSQAMATTFRSINISKCSYPVHCKDSMLQNGLDILSLSDITSLSIDVCICLVRGHLPSPRPRPIALGLKLQRFPLIENFEKTPINCFAAASSFFLISSSWQ